MSAASPESTSPLDVEEAVRERYSAGAKERQEALCCPVGNDPGRFAFLPREVIEKDYGCGDPSPYIREGDTVLDLGSGAGRICYVASHIVGAKGRVHGVDLNDDMLAVAKKHQSGVAAALGFGNVEFHKGRIQDLRLDVSKVEAYLAEKPIANVADLTEFESYCDRLRRDEPMIADDSVDLVVSNCVLNLVRDQDKESLIHEIFRVLRRGGRVAISDIVCDEELPDSMKNDPELWSGCLSGAFREDEFLKAFERAGFYGVEMVERSDTPWQVVDGYEFRSVTVTAWKGKEGVCLERNQAVIYNGPWKQVEDDDGHVYRRGERIAVCDKTFQIMSRAPYAAQVSPIPPRVEIPVDEAALFACCGTTIRSPRITKGEGYSETIVDAAAGATACEPGSDCC